MAPLVVNRRVGGGFERLYQRHVAQIYRYVLAILEHEADAEDATQQTFLSAYRAWERGERPRRPHNWLIAIAHNVCRQRFRESARRPSEVVLDEASLPLASDEEAPRAAEIRRALAHLAFNQRAALVMRELEGRPYREIGELLGVSQSAVETLLFRARRALREQLEGQLTCGEAEHALSRHADGLLSRPERASLRAHLRECPECASLERSQRARRAAFRGLAGVPLPESLAAFGGGSTAGVGAAAGIGIAAKAAAVASVGVLAAGVGEYALSGPATERGEAAPVAAGDTREPAESGTAHTAEPRGGERAGERVRAPSRSARMKTAAIVGGRAASIDSAAEPAPVTAPAAPTYEPAAPADETPPAAAQAPVSSALPVAPAVEVAPPSVPVASPPAVGTPAPAVPVPAVPSPQVPVSAPAVPSPPVSVPSPPTVASLPSQPAQVTVKQTVNAVTETVKQVAGPIPAPAALNVPKLPPPPQLPVPALPSAPALPPPQVPVPAPPTVPSAPQPVEVSVSETVETVTQTVEQVVGEADVL